MKSQPFIVLAGQASKTVSCFVVHISVCEVFVTLDRNLEFQQNIKVLPFGMVAKVFKKFDWRNRYSSKQMFEVLYLWNWLCQHRFTSNRL